MEIEDHYKLSSELFGHSLDVRGVAVGVTEQGKEFVVSASRDKTSKIWHRVGEDYQVYQTCEGHTNFISCVYVIPPNGKYPDGLILTGGHDHTILAFVFGNHHPIFRLTSHKNTVCSINANDVLIITGSWDHTAKLWREQENVATLIGHTHPVWAVATIPEHDDHFLTASADHEIRLWINSKTHKVFRGHTDCVRALAVLDSNRFISGSNDASILLWDIGSGIVIHSFYGHTNFIYSLTVLPDGSFASVGEDRTLRIWKDNDSKQVIFHPCVSVWTVTAMPNGDIVTGASDGVVRIFTNQDERMASQEVQMTFDDAVAKTAVAAELELGGMKVTDLPGPEGLLAPGKKDGDTLIVREGAKVVLYSWSASDNKWSKVGDVVGGSGATKDTSGKVLYEGKEYDYVFTIEIGEDSGMKSLKLPFNRTEDPWFAAQNFLERNTLDQMHLDQVANFIIKNSSNLASPPSNSEYADPFTGENRYVPGSRNANSFGGVDPFTGSGAYRTGSAPAPIVDLGPPEFPVSLFQKFPQSSNLSGLRGKLTEFVNSMDLASTLDEKCVPEILRLASPPVVWDSSLDNSLRMCLDSFPEERVFPILDLLRFGVMDPQTAQLATQKMNIMTNIVQKYLSSKSPLNQLLVLKLTCNLFGTETGAVMVARSEIISSLIANFQKDSKNQVAAATLLLNFSIVTSGCDAEGNRLNANWSNKETQTEILLSAIQLLDYLDAAEAAYRLLVGIGNLITHNPMTTELFKSLGGEAMMENYKKNGAEPKIKNCAAQIIAVIRH